MNKKTGIVILNYLNYKDTIECIESALELDYGCFDIIVVDNGSKNGSYEILKNRYKLKNNVYILKLEKNLGYAKGNNYGINYAINNLACEFVLVVNNDTLFKDKNLLKVLIDFYDGNTGVIGPKIINKEGFNQNPVNTSISVKQAFKDFILSLIIVLRMKNILKKIKSFIIADKDNKMRVPHYKSSVILHGSALLFTPVFFKYYTGFYPGTFLYYEENILALLANKAGLKLKYVPYTYIFHKEDMSSAESFNNNDFIKSKYIIRSIIHFFILKFLSYNLVIKIFHFYGRKYS